jgi:phage tail tape-measure protein
MKRTMTLLITLGLLTASAAQIEAVERSVLIDGPPAVAEIGWAVGQWNEAAGYIAGGAFGAASGAVGWKIGTEVGGLLGGVAGALFGGALGGF